ncbi:MAG: ATP-binding protein [Brooklawnia sp.]|nr:ATP-binding protein [Brooklawnia sp.]
MASNPYTPGFGQRPLVVVGRERQLARGHETLLTVAGTGRASTSPLVLLGVRGIGKTVALGLLRDDADHEGFVTVQVRLDRISSAAQLITSGTAEQIAPLAAQGASGHWRRFTELIAQLSIEVSIAGVVTVGRRPAEAAPDVLTERQVLARSLISAAQLARGHGSQGLAIFIDEIQEARPNDLVVLVNALQDALTAPSTPIAIFAAGLPDSPARLMAAGSFAERFEFSMLEPFDARQATAALVGPAVRVGVSWDAGAAELLAEESGGSPYLVQLFGDAAWRAGRPASGGVLSRADADAAIAASRESLQAGMFPGRWARCTDGERALLIAIATVADREGIAASEAITAALGKSGTPGWSRVRSSLINKGYIVPRGRGKLGFSIAGFRDFVLGIDDSAETLEADAMSRLRFEQLPPGELPPSPEDGER